MTFAYQVIGAGRQRDVVCSEACRAELLGRKRTPPTQASATQVIAVLNQKGGTGKTTTSVSVAAGLARAGKRTLLIDVDAQGNVLSSLGPKPRRSLYHVLIEGLAPEEAIVPCRPNLDLLCADRSLAAAEIELVNARDRSHLLRRRLASVLAPESPYDYVLLDCAPSLSLLNQNALLASGHVLITVSCDYLALVGVKQVLRTLKHINEVLQHPVEVLGVLPTFYDVRNRISKQSVASLSAYFGDRVLPPIRVNSKLKEAPSYKQSIFEYAPESHGAVDYEQAVGWIVSNAAPMDEASSTVAMLRPCA